MNIKFLFQISTVTALCLGCSQIPIFNKEAKIKNTEFDQLVKVEEVEVVSNEDTSSNAAKTKKKLPAKKTVSSQPKKKVKKSTTQKKIPLKNTKPVDKKTTENKTVEKQPEKIKTAKTPKNQESKKEVKQIQNSKNTISADSLKDSPFQIGEKTVIEVSYLNMTAGYLTLETKGIVKVNGRYSYHFRGSIKSRKLFAFVYSVDDVADTYVDIETLNPYSLNFKVVETKKTKDSKTFFNWKTKKATYWSRKVRKGRKPKEVKKTWDLKDGAQNFVSALFYLRTIDFAKNKKFTFPLADEGKNVTLKGRVLRKEKIETEAGTFDAWLVEPEFHIDGSLTPVGELKMWFKADKQQSLVKVKTKLKFGSIIGEASKLVTGKHRDIKSLRNSTSYQNY